MNDGTLAVFFGLALGFLFGVGLALALAHLLYRMGYRRAVADSLEPVRPKKYKVELEEHKKRRSLAAAKRAAERGVVYLPEDIEAEQENEKQPRLPAPGE